MTELEWLSDNAHAQHMVGRLQSLRLPRTKAGRRKLRLFACGCCRAVWDLLPPGPLQEAVRLAEHFADGLATKAELAHVKGRLPARSGPVPHDTAVAAGLVEFACYQAALDAAFGVTCYGESLPGRAGRRSLSDLLRCVFGNPFRPAAVDPAWLTSAAVGLAAAIYDGRAFHDLPILADALEEAGCDDEAALAHCRGGGPHARGCWVVDAVAGRG